MIFPLLLLLFSGLQKINAQVDANGITLEEKIEEVERQILNPDTLFSVVAPCSINGFGDPRLGEQTSAMWMRIVFHDAITKNIAGPGLGGLDASIGFESDRPENVGIFVNVTLGQFSQFSSVFLSMSDLIAIGLSDVLTSCDATEPRLPLRVGRIDATEAGPAGVPKPDDTFDFALNAFKTAGFTQTEMIQAVSCGHSIGGVHHTNFPDIVPELNEENNSHSRTSWDTTVGVWDTNQVNEYLDGTGHRGGPLVTGPALTNSDFRIFNSDGNATITAMRSAAAFRNTCLNVFAKMLDTVPNSVTLSAPVGPRPWLIRQAWLDLNAAGQVTYTATIIGHGPASSLPNNASYQYLTVGGGNTGPKLTHLGVTRFNNSIQDTPIGFQQIIDYDVFDNQFTGSGGFTVIQYIVRAAILNSVGSTRSTLTAKIWFPVDQPGTVVPKIISATATMTPKSTLGYYIIFEAVVTLGDGIAQTARPNRWIRITKGTTQLSAYYEATHSPLCDNSDLKTC